MSTHTSTVHTDGVTFTLTCSRGQSLSPSARSSGSGLMKVMVSCLSWRIARPHVATAEATSSSLDGILSEEENSIALQDWMGLHKQQGLLHIQSYFTTCTPLHWTLFSRMGWLNFVVPTLYALPQHQTVAKLQLQTIPLNFNMYPNEQHSRHWLCTQPKHFERARMAKEGRCFQSAL